MTVEMGPVCVTCGNPGEWGLVSGSERATVYCWKHDQHGDVDPVRAAWRRYNSACSAINAAFEENDQPTSDELQERDEAKIAIEAAIRAEGRAAYERGWNAALAASGGSPLLYLQERDPGLIAPATPVSDRGGAGMSKVTITSTLSCFDCASSTDRYHFCGRAWCTCPVCKPTAIPRTIFNSMSDREGAK